MAKIDKFEDLECWQAARRLCKLIFKLEGPIVKDWSTKDQLRRASLSVMNNIAEGFGRYSRPEMIRFLDFAQSSASEVKSMLYLLEDVDYLTSDELADLHREVDLTRAKILRFIKYLRNSSK